MFKYKCVNSKSFVKNLSLLNETDEVWNMSTLLPKNIFFWMKFCRICLPSNSTNAVLGGP